MYLLKMKEIDYMSAENLNALCVRVNFWLEENNGKVINVFESKGNYIAIIGID